LKGFIKTVVAAEVIIITVLALMVVYYGRFPDVRILFLSLTVLVYWISYQAISKPDLFLQTEPVQVFSLGHSKTQKYAHSSLREEEAARIEKELNDVMKHQRLFLDSSLTIDLLSAKLKTTRHHLSQVINDKLGKTYGDYVCEWRLEESRKKLCDPSNNRFTIAAIALDSGFSSVSSFNDVFKKRYGTTPSKFREQFLNKMSA
jgi:AraC-like DNA-binding protein